MGGLVRAEVYTDSVLGMPTIAGGIVSVLLHVWLGEGLPLGVLELDLLHV